MIILLLIILRVKNHSCMGYFGAQYYRAMENLLAQAI
jgi:hypothetical protein